MGNCWWRSWLVYLHLVALTMAFVGGRGVQYFLYWWLLDKLEFYIGLCFWFIGYFRILFCFCSILLPFCFCFDNRWSGGKQERVGWKQKELWPTSNGHNLWRVQNQEINQQELQPASNRNYGHNSCNQICERPIMINYCLPIMAIMAIMRIRYVIAHLF